jgi:hypothetical protein
MDKKKPFPDDFGGVRNLIHDLKKEVEEIKTTNRKLSLWALIWGERAWTIPTTIMLLLAAMSGTAYISSLILDSHIQTAIQTTVAPLQKDIQRIDGDLREIKGMLSVLRTEIAAEKYSKIPPKELKAHSEELKRLQKTLANLSPSSPGYWPTAFQVIQLASQSTFADWDKIAAMGETVLSNVTSRPPGAVVFAPNKRFFLQNHVEGMIIKNSIVRFDPNVELVNDVFINCVFLIPVQENPSKPLQEIGKTLLASDLSKVTLNAS